jgi:hypothetical protein
MATAAQSDFLGEGTNASVKKPYDPNDEPNPDNPGGISNNQLMILRAQNTQRATDSKQRYYQPDAQPVTAAQKAERAKLLRAQVPDRPKSDKTVLGDIKKIWTSDPVTTAVLAAPYAVGAAGALIPAAAGAVAPTAAAPTLGAVGTVASPFPASAAAGAAGPAMYSAAAPAAGAAAAAGGVGSTVRDIAKYGLGAVGALGTIANLPGGSSGAPAAATTAGGQQTSGLTGNYAPAGGYLQPTVTQPSGSQSTQNPTSALSPEARNLIAKANQFGAEGAFTGSGMRATGAQASNSAAAQRLTPTTQPQSTSQSVVQQAQQFAAQNNSAVQGYNQQGATAGNRAAPQITAPSSAQQQAVYNAAGSFQPNTSGVAGIRAATADVSGAQRLEGFQSTNSQQGVDALYGYNPDATYLSANQLGNFTANNTAEGANAVAGFRPDMVQQDAQSLRNFRADQSGIDRLNSYADEAQGPSAAQAMLRSQSDADKRTMLAIARSGRGGPGAAVNAQRQAITEGGLISAETRGQGAALAAQEFEAYKGRQLQALAQAGSLISQSEAQRLTALSNAGALMSQADQQKLSALQAYGQLKATQDSQQLSARQSAGQLNLGADQARLGAISNAAQVQSSMDAQQLSAQQSAANIRLQGSAINQQGQIAATQAELAGSAQQLQAMGLQAQIASDVRNQDISVLKSNLDASLQQMNLNDTQVRYFAGLGAQVNLASQNMQQQAAQFGVSADQAQQSLNLQYQQAIFSQLSSQQQLEYNYNALNANVASGNASQAMQQQQITNQSSQFNAQLSAQQQAQQRQFYGGLLLGAAQL